MKTTSIALQLHLMGAFAEFERSIIKERQREGIEKAKQEGRYTGRKATINPDKVHEMHSSGMGATAIAKELGIGRASVYRILEATRNVRTLVKLATYAAIAAVLYGVVHYGIWPSPIELCLSALPAAQCG